MGVLKDVLDRLDREDELDVEAQAAMQDYLRLVKTAPREPGKPGLGPRVVMTPELVAATRRYARALTARGEYMIQVARRIEDQLSEHESET
jgi:hypothetical protein